MKWRRWRQWVWLIGDGVLLLTAAAWLITGHLWLLLTWEAVGVLYISYGSAAVWNGSSERYGSARTARLVVRLAWVLPLLASTLGASAAVAALSARQSPAAGDGAQVLLAVAASVGVVLAWLLLHVGFAGLYQSLDESDPDVEAIKFPGTDTTPFLNYLYFSFTIGTAFATSDARVVAFAVRRVVLVHAVVAFLYNALVIATAIQVLQQLVSS